MALGRRSTCRTSLTLTPARLSEIDNEKNAIPKDIANRGWRLTESTGAKTGPSQALISSNHEAWVSLPANVRLLSYPVVATRMLCTRLAGGSTSASDFSQRRPASASASRGPHSAHCIPFLLSPGITSPAYKYVVAGVQVPHARGLSLISPCPPEPLVPWQFLCNPCLAG